MPPTESTVPAYTPLRFHCWTGDPEAPAYSLVTVTHADQMRAEQKAAALGLSLKRHPMTMTTLWVWASMVRAQATDLRWEDFREAVQSLDRVEDPDDTDPDDDDEVGPTVPSTS